MTRIDFRLAAKEWIVGRVIFPILQAFHLYRDKWRSFIAVYLIIFGLSILGIVLAILSVVPLVGALLCFIRYPVQIGGAILSFFLVLSLYKPIEEGIYGKRISYWKKHVEENVVNGIMIIAFYVCVFILWAVVWGIILGVLVGLFFLTGSEINSLWMILFVGVGVAAVVSYLLAMLFLMFTPFELILGKKRMVDKARGVVDSAKRSINLVKNNFWDVFLYRVLVIVLNIVFLLLIVVLPLLTLLVLMGMTVGPSSLSTLTAMLATLGIGLVGFILMALVWIVWSGLIWAPVMLISQIILWKLCMERMRVRH